MSADPAISPHLERIEAAIRRFGLPEAPGKIVAAPAEGPAGTTRKGYHETLDSQHRRLAFQRLLVEIDEAARDLRRDMLSAAPVLDQDCLSFSLQTNRRNGRLHYRLTLGEHVVPGSSRFIAGTASAVERLLSRIGHIGPATRLFLVDAARVAAPDPASALRLVLAPNDSPLFRRSGKIPEEDDFSVSEICEVDLAEALAPAPGTGAA